MKAFPWMQRHVNAVTLVAVLLIVTCANLLFTARQINASRSASASVVQLCQSANVARGQQITLWDHLITTAKPPPHQTPQQAESRAKATAGILTYIRHVFAPRNCAARFH